MTGIAYEQPGATSTAFLPMPAKYAGTWMQYKQDTEGQPGTQGVPAPRDHCGPGADGGIFLGGGPSGSKNMPPHWYPTLYYQRQLPAPSLFPAGANYGGPSVYSDNQMPIPARGWGGTSFAAPGMGSHVAMLQGSERRVKGRGGVVLGQNPILATPVTPWWASG